MVKLVECRDKLELIVVGKEGIQVENGIIATLDDNGLFIYRRLSKDLGLRIDGKKGINVTYQVG